MKLRPLQDRIIVKRVDQEKTTASGIVIPDNAAEKPDQGEVHRRWQWQSTGRWQSSATRRKSRRHRSFRKIFGPDRQG